MFGVHVMCARGNQPKILKIYSKFTKRKREVNSSEQRQKKDKKVEKKTKSNKIKAAGQRLLIRKICSHLQMSLISSLLPKRIRLKNMRDASFMCFFFLLFCLLLFLWICVSISDIVECSRWWCARFGGLDIWNTFLFFCRCKKCINYDAFDFNECGERSAGEGGKCPE